MDQASSKRKKAKRSGRGRGSRGGRSHGSHGSGSHRGHHQPAVDPVAAAEVTDDFKNWIDGVLEQFSNSDEQVLEFPATLTSKQRKHAHDRCTRLGLISKSYGSGNNRHLTARKQEQTSSSKKHTIVLKDESVQLLGQIAQALPLTDEERAAIGTGIVGAHQRSRVHDATGTSDLAKNADKCPPLPQRPKAIARFTAKLPAAELKQSILDTLQTHQVVLLSGETGSGKTTQVPQFLLEHAAEHGKPCTIVCTQPRRISAISVAKRVAEEYGTQLGDTVGYSIRLDRRMGPNTKLLFCTTGLLLRLVTADPDLNYVTHVIVDEVHERDRFSDFLLICLRELLKRRSDIHIIIMSATLHADLFTEYFGGCPRLHIQGRTFPVQANYLEEVLVAVGFRNPSAREQHPTEIKHAMDALAQILDQAWHANVGLEADSYLMQAYHTIVTENIDVDFCHPVTGVTPLMVAAAKNSFTFLQQFLQLGASPSQVHDLWQWTAADFAAYFGFEEVVQALVQWGMEDTQDDLDIASPEQRALVQAYQATVDPERVDINLIIKLIEHILRAQPAGEGAILVFLPGYEEIVNVVSACQQAFGTTVRAMPLHSSCSNKEQQAVFNRPLQGVTKIVCSTNIAETAVTIEDVVYVIDSGRVKEKSFDAGTSTSTLAATWISRASASQRRGRAGRVREGLCYHLFSRKRRDMLQAFQKPELLRESLEDLCLQAKLLAGEDMTLVEFLSLAPESPDPRAVQAAADLLQRLSILDDEENITELGYRLSNLSVEPSLARMLLIAYSLGCLDPIMVLACANSYREPFQLPVNPDIRAAAKDVHRKWAGPEASDHLRLLRAYYSWEAASKQGNGSSFCRDNFMSESTLRTIQGMKKLLQAQLQRSKALNKRRRLDLKYGNRHQDKWVVVKAALCSGLYPNVARHNTNTQNSFSTRSESRVKIHPNSCVKARKGQWVVYNEIARVERMTSMREITPVIPAVMFVFGSSLSLVAADLAQPRAADGAWIGTHAGSEDEDEMDSGPDAISDEQAMAMLADDNPSEFDVDALVGKLEGVHEEGAPQGPRRKPVFADEWIAFYTDPETYLCLRYVRAKWHAHVLDCLCGSRAVEQEDADMRTDMLLSFVEAADPAASEILLSNHTNIGAQRSGVRHEQGGRGRGGGYNQGHNHGGRGRGRGGRGGRHSGNSRGRGGGRGRGRGRGRRGAQVDSKLGAPLYGVFKGGQS